MIPALQTLYKEKLRDSLRLLLSLDFDILTFAHGTPITQDARLRLTQLIA